MKKYVAKLMAVFAIASTMGITVLWGATIGAVASAMGIKLDELTGLSENLVALVALAVPMAYFMFLLVVVDKKVTEWAEK